MTTTADPIVWTPPSPGQWTADTAHQTTPHGRFFDSLYMAPYSAGFAEGIAAVGAPLAALEYATVNGWLYYSLRPLGGPAEPKGPPPKLLMSLLFALVPTLRRRKRTATKLFARRPWVDEAATWFGALRERYDARLRALAAAPLDGPDLGAHLRAVCDYGRDIGQRHFRQFPAQAVALGDFLVHTMRWTGRTAAQIMPALAGYSPPASRPLVLLDAVVAALDAAGRLDALDGDDALSALRAASNAAAEALDAYLDEYGDSPLGGETPMCPIVSERPDLLVASLRARRGAPHDEAAVRARSDAAADVLRQLVPAEERERWDAMLADARVATSVRDSDGAIFFRWLGLMRRTLQACGALLVARERMADPESVYDVTEDELQALLAGAGPTRAEIEALTATRRFQATLTPPPLLGPDLGPPPIDRFPAAIARVTEAIMTFVARFDAEADPITGEGLAGHGVSSGAIEGTARVLHGPDDFARVQPGDVLVARATSGSFNVVLAMAGAVVTEVGGLISHAAIVAREFGMPGVVGCAGVLTAVADGAWVRVDGDRGTVEVLAASAPHVTSATPRAAAPPAPTVARAPKVPGTPGRCVALREADDDAMFGGKAAHLASLLDAGIAAPAGIALDADFVEAVAAQDGPHIERLAAALAGLSRPLAVRSSGVAEDGAEASFAGQYRTVLGVSVDTDVIAAVGAVWASADSEGVRAYYRRMGLTGPAPRMGAVIQPLVAADVAGVLFDDPTGQRFVVEAVRGLGETLVDGQVTPQQFELDASGVVTESSRGSQDVALVVGPRGRLERQSVPPDDGPCLDAGQLRQLADLARACRERFGAPQDVEWAFAGDTLWCLQSRPVTRGLPDGARQSA